MKLANRLADKPYFMQAAANSLRCWVQGAAQQAPPLDVSYVRVQIETPPAPREATRVGHGGAHASAVEPDPSEVRVLMGREADQPRPPKASAKARVVHPMAATLVQTLGYSWPEALEIARASWDKLDPAVKAVLGEARGTVAEPPRDAGAPDSEAEAEGPMLGEEM